MTVFCGSSKNFPTFSSVGLSCGESSQRVCEFFLPWRARKNNFFQQLFSFAINAYGTNYLLQNLSACGIILNKNWGVVGFLADN